MFAKSKTILLAILFCLPGATYAQDVPVVLNPLHASEGYMFDWIFFAIMIPLPAFLYWDSRRS